MQERVAIFIDGRNFYYCMKNSVGLSDMDLDFEKLIKFLLNDRKLSGVFYYNASLDQNYNEKLFWKHQKFLDKLRKIGISVKMAKMRKRKIGKEIRYEVKEDDVHLAIDMVDMAHKNEYDTAILISGDGDFRPVVKMVKDLNKEVENAHFTKGYSRYLKSVSNKSTTLDETIKKIMK